MWGSTTLSNGGKQSKSTPKMDRSLDLSPCNIKPKRRSIKILLCSGYRIVLALLRRCILWTHRCVTSGWMQMPCNFPLAGHSSWEALPKPKLALPNAACRPLPRNSSAKKTTSANMHQSSSTKPSTSFAWEDYSTTSSGFTQSQLA